jgi:hypothetical protein
MRFDDLRAKAPKDFQRLTGVERTTFDAMLAVIQRASSKFGRPPKLSDGDQLLLTLMYWREYRAQYHIAADYNISEPTCSRIIRRIEAILSASPQFALPKRLPKQSSQFQLEVVIIDVTETPVQRPQKKRTSAPATAARRSGTR